MCPVRTLAKNGRTGEIRTRDQRIKSPLLYRLSYRPIFSTMQKTIQGIFGLVAIKKILCKFYSSKLQIIARC